MSLHPGTIIVTSGGLKPIEEVKTGVEVLSHRFEWCSVDSILVDVVQELVLIQTEANMFECTPNQQLMTGQGWVEADAITRDHSLSGFKDTKGRLCSIGVRQVKRAYDERGLEVRHLSVEHGGYCISGYKVVVRGWGA